MVYLLVLCYQLLYLSYCFIYCSNGKAWFCLDLHIHNAFVYRYHQLHSELGSQAKGGYQKQKASANDQAVFRNNGRHMRTVPLLAAADKARYRSLFFLYRMPLIITQRHNGNCREQRCDQTEHNGKSELFKKLAGHTA